MRILLAEDDDALREMLALSLRRHGHQVDEATDGFAAEEALRGNGCDLLVLDLGMPRLDGVQLLRRMRARHDPTPVLVLTARDAVDERVLGLKLGADDYMTKPFALPELEARVEALIRRAAGGLTQVTLGTLRMALSDRQVWADGQPLELSAREAEILEQLMRKAGQVVIKSRIAQRLSDDGNAPSDNTIEVYIHRLRRKIEPAGVRIRTIHGLGYLLHADEPEA
jgi:two-component system OmpR family response regulator